MLSMDPADPHCSLLRLACMRDCLPLLEQVVRDITFLSRQWVAGGGLDRMLRGVTVLEGKGYYKNGGKCFWLGNRQMVLCMSASQRQVMMLDRVAHAERKRGGVQS
jgi:hypothetical protein